MARNHQARRPRGADDMQPHLRSCHIGPLGCQVGALPCADLVHVGGPAAGRAAPAGNGGPAGPRNPGKSTGQGEMRVSWPKQGSTATQHGCHSADFADMTATASSTQGLLLR